MILGHSLTVLSSLYYVSLIPLFLVQIASVSVQVSTAPSVSGATSPVFDNCIIYEDGFMTTNSIARRSLLCRGEGCLRYPSARTGGVILDEVLCNLVNQKSCNGQKSVISFAIRLSALKEI